MKKTILTLYLFIFGFGCTTKKDFLTNQLKNCKLEHVLLEKHNESLKRHIVSLQETIEDQENQIQIMRDELQFKESEISYWGHKYDSCILVLKKHK